MTFNEAGIFLLVMLGGMVMLIAVIAAGGVAFSFMFHAEPIPEVETAASEAEPRR